MTIFEVWRVSVQCSYVRVLKHGSDRTVCKCITLSTSLSLHPHVSVCVCNTRYVLIYECMVLISECLRSSSRTVQNGKRSHFSFQTFSNTFILFSNHLLYHIPLINIVCASNSLHPELKQGVGHLLIHVFPSDCLRTYSTVVTGGNILPSDSIS